MKLLTLSALTSLSLFSSVLSANDLYIGGSIASLTHSKSDFNDLDLLAFSAKMGFQFNDSFSTEIRYAGGIEGDSSPSLIGRYEDPTSDFTMDVDLKKLYGVYLRAGVANDSNIYPYTVIGIARTDIKYASMYGASSNSETGLSYGFGADIKLDGFSFTAEYTIYSDRTKDNSKVNGFSIGLTKYF
ncbi:hypothetical protein DS2_15679 [Catenovulum agarivorans DS-2]|uniref:Outer membrane protein beta-barrel domain-containing protein n=1 Tax=Catenovulum agarivorans DS-2 TaxID=1328313 RepID=W7QTK9_9ALTE|nr:outer membrane beta-barrel protein [Catenovulum agarivorans]EWH08765.1 hypothetical protein DS2_15679 [Catenovulum agarivorans DS-2]